MDAYVKKYVEIFRYEKFLVCIQYNYLVPSNKMQQSNNINLIQIWLWKHWTQIAFLLFASGFLHRNISVIQHCRQPFRKFSLTFDSSTDVSVKRCIPISDYNINQSWYRNIQANMSKAKTLKLKMKLKLRTQIRTAVLPVMTHVICQ